MSDINLAGMDIDIGGLNLAERVVMVSHSNSQRGRLIAIQANDEDARVIKHGLAPSHCDRQRRLGDSEGEKADKAYGKDHRQPHRHGDKSLPVYCDDIRDRRGSGGGGFHANLGTLLSRMLNTNTAQEPLIQIQNP